MKGLDGILRPHTRRQEFDFLMSRRYTLEHIKSPHSVYIHVTDISNIPDDLVRTADNWLLPLCTEVGCKNKIMGGQVLCAQHYKLQAYNKLHQIAKEAGWDKPMDEDEIRDHEMLVRR